MLIAKWNCFRKLLIRMKKKTVNIIAKGTVQGVGFRYYTQSLARSLGVKGFVKNLPDGSVEIEAEGEQNILEEMILKLRRDEMSSYITDMDIVWFPFKNKYTEFFIAF